MNLEDAKTVARTLHKVSPGARVILDTRAVTALIREVNVLTPVERRVDPEKEPSVTIFSIRFERAVGYWPTG